MRTNLTEPKTLFVIGLPRGGTTIVARVFDSLEDGFCLGEPVWLRENFGSAARALGKVCADPPETDIIHWLHTCSGGWQLAGFKETLFRYHGGIYEKVEKWAQEVDVLVVVFRDPRQVLASQSAHGYSDAKSDERDYLFLEKLANVYGGVKLHFESFVQNPLPYLNARLPFAIQGPLQLVPTDHSYGDPRANRSRFVRPPTPRHPDHAPKEATLVWKRSR